MRENVTNILLNSKLCKKMTESQVIEMLKNSVSRLSVYNKNDIIFREGDIPTKLYVLVEGKVSIIKDTASGKRILLTNIENKGDLFGEVYLFIDKLNYDMYAIAAENSIILEISSKMFSIEDEKIGNINHILMQNILKLLAEKAYMMNNKIKVLGSGGVREKIIRFLFHSQKGDKVDLKIKREDMADYLNITRPSLSRELSKMQEEGIIQVIGRTITILKQEVFEEYL